ncbi:hypothetical protein [Streptomyces sp. NPDC056682]|uniref:hypothetical protein n=1 Tax=Streptomyces sp. NPDC056682 TaxID=3345909 RepID=UPI0036C55544
MPEPTPNAKGPAKGQMPPPSPEATAPEPTLVPAEQVKPEDTAMLQIEYRNGQPVIVVSDGKLIPAGLAVVDGAGNPVAAYKAGSASAFTAQNRDLLSTYDFPGDDTPIIIGSARMLLVLADEVRDQVTIREPAEGIHPGLS